MSTITLPQQTSPLGLNKPQTSGSFPGDDNYEIVDGQRVELPPMSILAVLVNAALHGHLWSFVTSRKLGRAVPEGMFILDAAKKFQRKPDLAFVSSQTWPLDRPVPDVGDWQVVPDLAAEIVSPHDLFEDVLAKILEYFSLGVKCAWIVSPLSKKVFVFDSPRKVTLLGIGDELDGGQLIPGFRLKLNELFENAAPVDGAQS